MLKPSIKSVEGASFIGIVAGVLGLLYSVLLVPRFNLPPVEELLNEATNFTEIAHAYANETDNISKGLDVGTEVGLLIFLYKLYGRFTDARTSLKVKELENV